MTQIREEEDEWIWPCQVNGFGVIVGLLVVEGHGFKLRPATLICVNKSMD
jgi:hypothetical protein